MPSPNDVVDMIERAGGKATEAEALPGGQDGYVIASFPLPKDHWLYDPGRSEPPMGMLTGTSDPRRKEMEVAVRDAVRYAYRACTMNGTEDDIDPDALVQNVIVGLIGYYTHDGL